MSFNDLLYNSAVIKAASIERPDDTQFEQDFSNLAFSFLQDTAAPLLEHLIGFEVVERAEDDTRAVGMFGFHINENFYYIPTFFVGGQVKGMDSIFSKKQSQFYPLIEEWINTILGKGTKTLGTTATREDLRNAPDPDFSLITTPPGSNGYNSGFKAAEAWDDMRAGIAERMEKDAIFREMLDGALISIDKYAAFENNQPSKLKQYIKEAGGEPAVYALLNTIVNSVDFVKAASEFYTLPDELVITEFSKTACTTQVKKAKNIKVISLDDDNPECHGPITPTEKSRLVRDGFTIKDSRKPEEKSETIKKDYEQSFTTPSESGKYNMLFSDGTTAEVDILTPTSAGKNAFVYFGEDKGYNCKLSKLIVQGDKLEDTTLYDKATKLSNILPSSDDKYVLINEDNKVFYTISVKNIVKDGDRPMSLKVYVSDLEVTPYDQYYSAGRPYPCCEPYVETIKVSDTDNTSPHVKGNVLTISNNKWRLLKVDGSYQAKDNLPLPGTISDFNINLTKAGVHDISVYSNDQIDYVITFDGKQEEPRGYKSALCRLVVDYNMGELPAIEMIKQAAYKKKSSRWIKAAQIPPMDGVGVAMPPMPEPIMGAPDPFTGVPVDTTTVQSTSAPMTGFDPMQDPMQPGFNLAENNPMGSGPMDLANQAADLGQKQVFDHAVIGGLSGLQGTTELMDSYVPSFMETMDKLGRILFLFYWKADDFVERYGEEDFEDMEDKLKATYRQFGEMVYLLKKKDINKEED